MITSILSLILSVVFAQVEFTPAPVSGEIVMSTSIISMTMRNKATTSKIYSLNFDNSKFSISIDRCGKSIGPNQTCTFRVGINQSQVADGATEIGNLRDGTTNLTIFKFSKAPPAPATSSIFQTTSYSLTDFSTQSVYIRNQTSTSQTYIPVFSGTNPDKFEITLNRCSTATNKNQTCQVSFRLKAVPNGTYSAILSAPNVENQVTINATVTNSPIVEDTFGLEATPTSFDFGTATKIGNSIIQTVSLKNIGNKSIIPLLEKSSRIAYTLNRCSSWLAPGASCSISFAISVTADLPNGVLNSEYILAKANSSDTGVLISTTIDIQLPPQSCQPGFHLENNICVSNTRSCTVTNGTGEQTWVIQSPTTGFWGACMVTACDEPYYVDPTQLYCAEAQYVANFGSTYIPPIPSNPQSCDGSVTSYQQIESCIRVHDSQAVALNLCTEPSPTVITDSPAGSIPFTDAIGSGDLTCQAGLTADDPSSTKYYTSCTNPLQVPENGVCIVEEFDLAVIQPQIGGLISGVSSGTYTSGTNLSATFTPAQNFDYTWVGACSGSGSCSFVMDADKQLSVQTFCASGFELNLAGDACVETQVPEYTLTVNQPAYGGTISGATSGQYPENTPISATFTPAQNFQFTWSGACSGSGACSFIMDSNKTLSVNVSCVSGYEYNSGNQSCELIQAVPGAYTQIISDLKSIPDDSLNSLLLTPSRMRTVGDYIYFADTVSAFGASFSIKRIYKDMENSPETVINYVPGGYTVHVLGGKFYTARVVRDGSNVITGTEWGEINEVTGIITPIQTFTYTPNLHDTLGGISASTLAFDPVSKYAVVAYNNASTIGNEVAYFHVETGLGWTAVDINSGVANSTPSAIAFAGSSAVMGATIGTNGAEAVRINFTNPSVGIPVELIDIRAGTQSGSMTGGIVCNNRYYAQVNYGTSNPNEGTEMVIIDESGPFTPIYINSGSSSGTPTNLLCVLNERVYFSGIKTGTDREPQYIDVTENSGASVVTLSVNGSASSNPTNFVFGGGTGGSGAGFNHSVYLVATGTTTSVYQIRKANGATSISNQTGSTAVSASRLSSAPTAYGLPFYITSGGDLYRVNGSSATLAQANITSLSSNVREFYNIDGNVMFIRSGSLIYDLDSPITPYYINNRTRGNLVYNQNNINAYITSSKGLFRYNFQTKVTSEITLPADTTSITVLASNDNYVYGQITTTATGSELFRLSNSASTVEIFEVTAGATGVSLSSGNVKANPSGVAIVTSSIMRRLLDSSSSFEVGTKTTASLFAIDNSFYTVATDSGGGNPSHLNETQNHLGFTQSNIDLHLPSGTTAGNAQVVSAFSDSVYWFSVLTGGGSQSYGYGLASRAVPSSGNSGTIFTPTIILKSNLDSALTPTVVKIGSDIYFSYKVTGEVPRLARLGTALTPFIPAGIGSVYNFQQIESTDVYSACSTCSIHSMTAKDNKVYLMIADSSTSTSSLVAYDGSQSFVVVASLPVSTTISAETFNDLSDSTATHSYVRVVDVGNGANTYGLYAIDSTNTVTRLNLPPDAVLRYIGKVGNSLYFSDDIQTYQVTGATASSFSSMNSLSVTPLGFNPSATSFNRNGMKDNVASGLVFEAVSRALADNGVVLISKIDTSGNYIQEVNQPQTGKEEKLLGAYNNVAFVSSFNSVTGKTEVYTYE